MTITTTITPISKTPPTAINAISQMARPDEVETSDEVESDPTDGGNPKKSIEEEDAVK
jgi:hypothetical protein